MPESDPMQELQQRIGNTNRMIEGIPPRLASYGGSFRVTPLMPHRSDLADFIRAANSDHEWARRAINLRISADVLLLASLEAREARTLGLFMEVAATVYMLRGMVAECYLKARFLRGGGNLYDSAGKFVSRNLRGSRKHDLVAMASQLGIWPSLTPGQQEMLKTIGACIMFSRYPAGMSHADTSRLSGVEYNWTRAAESDFQSLIEAIR